jgi:hypothetical protein
MTDDAAGAEKYIVMADRYAVFATIDGNPVGHDPEKDEASVAAGKTEIVVNGNPVEEQVCIGTMAFIGGKNIDTIEKNSDGTPVNNNSTKFPIFYRPNNLMYSKLNPSTTEGSGATNIVVKNISDINKGIKLSPALKGGSGLIYTKNKVGTPKTPVKKTLNESRYITGETTYGALGSDKLFLLSHNSQIPGKGKINFDDTLYGISVEKFADEIIPKTSSLVRGEELLELINMIVRFLVTHTHAYPGLPPVTVTQDGSSVDKILAELQNAVNKILNGNIRLN